MANHRSEPKNASSRSWDAVAGWYAGWSGAEGSRHHRALAIPALLALLDPRPGEAVLDIGCGPAPLASSIARAGGRYVGVDLSPRLIAVARKHHRERGRFLVGDATALSRLPDLAPASFDAAAFLLSIQDIDPLEAALASAAWAVKPGGRAVIVMTHPCFRVPRQSGWGFDEKRSLTFRRIDSYLSHLAVPMQDHGDGRGTTRSYHRPLGAYFEALAASGFIIDALREVPASTLPALAGETRAQRRAREEIPLFLALRAVKV